ncbi:MAG: hypothetical protein GY789_25965 [Hyphomicrobiales bacterium]|nr:hypothetical protein [Hyphomicrobiales bacterium]MCP4997586.1 hypothetical protein [Hyphomicrobiales bacterium]
MSTNGMSDWAVDLADTAAVYPLQGWEVPMFIIGLIFWIWWHWAQLRQEATEIQHETEADASGDAARDAIDRY